MADPAGVGLTLALPVHAILWDSLTSLPFARAAIPAHATLTLTPSRPARTPPPPHTPNSRCLQWPWQILLGFALDPASGTATALCASSHLTEFSGGAEATIARTGAAPSPPFTASDSSSPGSGVGMGVRGSGAAANMLPGLVVLGVLLVFLGAWRVAVLVDEPASEEVCCPARSLSINPT